MGGRDRWSRPAHLGLAALIYLPILTTAPGRVGADTKTYLYLDPGLLLRRALSMWDPNVGLGTVTHQTIGYLFPMGPYYWLMERIGSPDWFAQRLWLASVLFVAGAGVLFLTRTIGWAGAGPAIAALSYALSPYVLDYSARISVILLPWAALPWMIGLAMRAGRRGGWRDPAWFALSVALVGGVNATALAFAGLGPLLWFPFAVWGSRELDLRRAAATVARIGVLTTGVSVWWVAGLWAQGQYGIPILRYTETIEAVSRTSLASEVLRGLGYWFFYGNDKLGSWVHAGVPYTQSLWLLAAGFALPTAAFLAAGRLRWRYRSYFVLLLVLGVVIAVGAHPYADPSPLGWIFKAFAQGSTAGLALRSTARAVPLVALGVAVLIGASVTALGDRSRRLGLAAAVAASLVVVAGLPPLFTQTLALDRNLDRAEEVPAYWAEAGRALDRRGEGTRALEIPGSDFAAYRWGNTVDPITPYLTDRPYVARELIPYGSPASADLLNAFDRRLQEGVFEPSTIAPIARLMGAGDVVLRSDLQFERYRTPRPRRTWAMLTDPIPAGLSPPATFGPPKPNRPVPKLPLIDEIELATPTGAPHPPPVSVFGVDDAVPIVRLKDATRPAVVVGDGEGIVDSAAAGLLDGRSAVLYGAALPGGRAPAGADIVVTDTNRLRARRWGTVRENAGYTEQPGQKPLLIDPSDARLGVFPGALTRWSTVARQRGVESVVATRYGNPVSYTPEDRPANGIDGDDSTAWRVGAFADVEGERWRVELRAPVTIDSVILLQPITGSRNRWITTGTLRFDHGPPVPVTLGPESRQSPGQRITFPSRTVTRVEFEVGETNIGKRPKYDGVSGVGLAEVGVGDVRADEVLRLPSPPASSAGETGLDHRLALVMTRDRADPAEPVRFDPERHLARLFTLDAPRSFAVTVTARVSAAAPDEVVDDLLGTSRPGLVARSDARLPGDLASRASAAIDGSSATAWRPGFLGQHGHWLEIERDGTTPISSLNLMVVADGRHSVPTRVRLETDAGERTISLPPIADGTEQGHVVTVPVTFDAITARRLRLVIEAYRAVTTIDYYSESAVDMPVAIAELGVPGLGPAPATPARPTPGSAACRSDLLTLDGRPVLVRRVADLPGSDRGALRLQLCGAESIALGRGEHELRSAPGGATGLDVDRVVLSSGRGGGAEPAAAMGGGVVPGTTAVDSDGPTRMRLRIGPTTKSSWLVLGQSHNRGWRARLNGRDLGPPVLIDGYANGWVLDASDAARVVGLEWTPQRPVRAALAVSTAVLLACLGVLLFGLASRGRADRHRAPRRAHRRPGGDESPQLWAGDAARRWWVPPVVGGAAGLVAGPGVGALSLVVLAAAVLFPAIGRRVWPAGAAAMAAAGAYVIVQQARWDYPPDFAWPTFAERAHDVALFAVAMVVGATLLRPVPGRRGTEPDSFDKRTPNSSRSRGAAHGDPLHSP